MSARKTALLLVAAVLLCVLLGNLAGRLDRNRVGGRCGDEAYNLQLIRENLVDYENYEALPSAAGKPDTDKSSGFLVVRLKEDGWNLTYQSDFSLDKDRWTPEDLSRFSTVLIAVSHEESADYKSRNTGSTVTISTEKVKIYYYDTASGNVVKTEVIGSELPASKTSSASYTVEDDTIAEQFKKLRGEAVTPMWVFILCMFGSLAAGGAALFLLVMLIVKLKDLRWEKKRQQA